MPLHVLQVTGTCSSKIKNVYIYVQKICTDKYVVRSSTKVFQFACLHLWLVASFQYECLEVLAKFWIFMLKNKLRCVVYLQTIEVQIVKQKMSVYCLEQWKIADRSHKTCNVSMNHPIWRDCRYFNYIVLVMRYNNDVCYCVVNSQISMACWMTVDLGTQVHHDIYLISTI